MLGKFIRLCRRLPSHAAVAGGWLPLLKLSRDVLQREGWRSFAFKVNRAVGGRTPALADGFEPRVMDVQRLSEDQVFSYLGLLAFKVHARPQVSIILPVFNNWVLTVECLAALHRNGQNVSYEVLLVDDASTDRTPELLAGVPGVSYLRNEVNLGYLRSCNRALEEARGAYVCLLNNDTQVQGAWLDSLVDRLAQSPKIGAVGAKLLFPDGRLQEAGARLLRQDPSSADSMVGDLIGLGASPEDHLYRYAREVEYASGACLLVRRDLLVSFGGLDPRFAPAYFEDVDLAYQLRESGFSIFYEPRAEVVHQLSATLDGVAPDGAKMELVAKNARLFSDKWGDEIVANQRVRAIAFYLPQYHPIPENDTWWGPGFTEWTNVAKAKPNFSGHYQPHLPGELGFYDLRVPEVREQQAGLAREFGIHGFCYYAYWFNGTRLLNRPFDEVLSSGSPDFPFCICWANENWTRTWDGKDHHVLIGQQHSSEDDIAFIRSLMPALRDERYIRIHGRPLILVYKVDLLPDPAQTAVVWREQCLGAGVGDIYLACVHNNADPLRNMDPRTIGFDAAVEFPPLGKGIATNPPHHRVNPKFRGLCYDYAATAARFESADSHPFTYFRGVMPSWDNTARRQDAGSIFLGSSPEAYRDWLDAAVSWTARMRVGDERLVFINAWNEWGEGNHLEPDQRYERAYLQATADVMCGYGGQ